MNKLLMMAAATLALAGCATKPPATAARPAATPATQLDGPFVHTPGFTVRGVAADSDYGYSAKQPICVSDGKEVDAGGEYRYLAALAGPNGETLRYKRLGNCCAFETPNGFQNYGLLDRFEVSWKGAKKPVVLYLNMYDPAPDRDAVPAPQGLTVRSSEK